MAYRTILTHLPSSARAKELLKVAVPLAEAQGAHLIGLHVVPRVPVSFGMIEAQIPPDVIERQTMALEADAEAVAKIFEHETRGFSANVEWRCNRLEHANIASEIVEQARASELIIVSQEEPDPFGMRSDIPSAVVHGSGRPVIILPRDGGDELTDGVIRRVVIAWNRSRESARAAFDALPVLQHAEAVSIVCVDPPHATFGEELAATLARQGVKVEVNPVAREGRSVAKAIAAAAAAARADLIVMGSYGHSAFRESLFGGATYDLLDEMDRPIFMSH
jgi:nucleotide-binding universal stress UspA family protein